MRSSVIGALGLFTLSAGVAAAAPALIPLPAQIEPRSGVLQITQGARIVVPPGDSKARFDAETLADAARRTRGLSLVIREGGAGAIVFARSPQAATGPEAYDLDVTPAGVRITAASDAGLFYGAMTLAQLLSPDARFGAPVRLAAMQVRDAPRFAWRGLMLDVARHFQPLDSIKVLIDQMAAHKLNVLHLHLTDDQGWRLEIKRYPKLTAIGAWRATPSAGRPPSPTRVGGFYTQDEMRDLIAYAAARQVTIVPEIDMPGHAQAAVAAYPEVGVFGDRPDTAVDWGVNPYLFDVKPQSLAFIENVLDEVMALFPSSFIHVGGDEAIKDQWARSPAVQARMRQLGVKDEHGLQSWFIEHLGQYLSAHGRRLIGWDEILEGGLPASASVMSWRGERGAIDAANAGHDVVLSPAPTLYLDNLQSHRGDEQPGRLAIVTLKDVYAYDPLPEAIAAAEAEHVLGVQANAWSEYLITPQEVQHAVFPRLDALSEIAWSPKATRDWPGFLTRLDPQRVRYARQGVAAADTGFAVDYAVVGGAGAALRAGRAKVALSTQTGWGAIRYTLDGAQPTANSKPYLAPLDLPLGATIAAAAFAADGRPTAAPRRFDASAAALLTRDASQLEACPKHQFGLRVALTPNATEPAPAFDVDLLDTCYVYPAAPLDVVSGLTVHAARLARNYGLAADFDKFNARYAATRFGELVVRTGGCAGPVAATFPLPDPATADARLTFAGPLPKGGGDADLCLVFTAPIAGPSYAVDRVALTPAAALPAKGAGA